MQRADDRFGTGSVSLALQRDVQIQRSAQLRAACVDKIFQHVFSVFFVMPEALACGMAVDAQLQLGEVRLVRAVVEQLGLFARRGLLGTPASLDAHAAVQGGQNAAFRAVLRGGIGKQRMPGSHGHRDRAPAGIVRRTL